MSLSVVEGRDLGGAGNIGNRVEWDIRAAVVDDGTLRSPSLRAHASNIDALIGAVMYIAMENNLCGVQVQQLDTHGDETYRGDRLRRSVATRR